MCGIAGIVGREPPDFALLDRMAATMAARGPDGQRVWSDERAGLAFRRLAIIDLDERSMQPFHLGPWHLVFNGEIYNYLEVRAELRALGHAFVTDGDAEVLIHAWQEWEERALDRVDGMFALAIWNDERRQLTCACDRFGEKPLLWAESNGRLVFASGLRALLISRPDLGDADPAALGPYLGRGVMPTADRTFVRDVRRLPAAHVLRYREGAVTISRYWSPVRVKVPERYEEARDRLRELLVASISRRLRSDVPVGTSLSGGVDSSAVVGLAALIAGDHRRHAFTARFPGYERDEWRYAEMVARSAGVVEHHAVEPIVDGLLEELSEVLAGQEEPFGSLSIYAQWCVMAAARSAGVTVLLDGQGADELFGGYPGANGWAIRSMGLAAIARASLDARDRRDVAVAVGSDWLPEPIAARHRRALVTPYASAQVRVAAAAVSPPGDAGRSQSPLMRELLRQAFATSLPELLRYADRSSMAHSREVRLPFLDREVAEFAFSLPPSFVYRNGVRKAILRDAVRDVVPTHVLERRDKVAYEPPQAAWLADPRWVARIAETLLDRSARTSALVDMSVVAADARSGRWRDPVGIWRATNLELWLRSLETPVTT